MDLKLFGAVCLTMFVAKLDDKTHLATFLHAADASRSRVTILTASAAALVDLAGLVEDWAVRRAGRVPAGRVYTRDKAVAAMSPSRCFSTPVDRPRAGSPGASGSSTWLRRQRSPFARPRRRSAIATTESAMGR